MVGIEERIATQRGDTRMEDRSRPLDATGQTIHTIPTHLATADTVLSLGYLTLSSRQLLLLLLGGSVAASLWVRTAWLAALLPPVGAALHWLLLILLGCCILALTFGQIAGRSCDAWVIVLLAYLARPRVYLWRTIRGQWRVGEPMSDARDGET